MRPQSGSGILQSIKDTVMRIVPDSDENARPGFPGEHHAILKLQNGKFGVGNWIGPGTNVLARIKRGDPGRTISDSVARAHDLRYSLAKNVDDIRRADQKMVQKLESGIDDSPANIFMAKNIIKAKMGLENAGLLSRERFAGSLKKKRPRADVETLTTALNGMEQQGFGKKQKNQQDGGFFFLIAGMVSAIASAAAAAAASAAAITIGSTTVGAVAASAAGAAATGAIGAAAARAVNKRADRREAARKQKGKGLKSATVDAIRKTKVVLSDLSKTSQYAVKKGYEFIKAYPDKIKDVLQILVPHFKEALHKKLAQQQQGSGLNLAGAGGKMASDSAIANHAVRILLEK
tara:strand:+ start:1228 stop:2271 length:1044 start_codon:yes stop_codon:yes gene_type:complete